MGYKRVPEPPAKIIPFMIVKLGFFIYLYAKDKVVYNFINGNFT